VYLSEVAPVNIHITPDLADGRADWKAWFERWFLWLALHPEIKGFNLMPQDYRGTRCDRDYGWGNARIQDNQYLLGRWIAEMGSPRFVHQPEGPFLGY